MNRNTVLFLSVCIPIRIFIIYAVKDLIPYDILPYLSIILFIMGVGFARRFYNHTSTERGFFKGTVWWNDARPIHALLYIVAAFVALFDPKNTWIPLLIDVIVGICTFIYKRVLHN